MIDLLTFPSIYVLRANNGREMEFDRQKYSLEEVEEIRGFVLQFIDSWQQPSVLRKNYANRPLQQT